MATPAVNILTVDLEDWFHSLDPDPARWADYERRVEPITDQLLGTLDDLETRATFFVLGDVARAHPGLVRRIAQAGHEIGSHSFEHRFVYTQSQDAFRDDLRRSLGLLGDLTGQQITSYRAPYFSITERSTWAFDVLVDEGIRHDSSVFPVRNHRYGMHSFPRQPHEVRAGLMTWPLTCLPTPIGNLPCCGGVYLRLLPWTVTARCADRVAGRGEPIVAYLHPWELDPGHPRVAAGSAFLRWRHYTGLEGMQAKVTRLLQRYTFTSIAEATTSGTARRP
jgi:polysaccharide deacetylase family protein (PEP-CTERM system associated)